MSPPESDVAVLIPALDEEEALPPVLAALRAQGFERLVVVDNGSSDGTARVAEEEGATVVHEPRRGYGSACLAGIRALRSDPPAIVAFLDGDGSDDPADLPGLLAPIRAGEAEFVLGVRPGGRGRGGAVPWHARWGNAAVRAGMRLLHGAGASDLGPFRAIRFDALEALAMDDRNWGWTLQMQLRAHHAGLRVLEVPVRHRPRSGGRSKVSGTLRGSVGAGSKMLFTLVAERLRVGRAARKGTGSRG